MKVDFGDVLKNSFYFLIKDDTILILALIYTVIGLIVGFFGVGTINLASTAMNIPTYTVAAFGAVSILLALLGLYFSAVIFLRVNKGLKGDKLYKKALSRYPALIGTSILSGIVVVLGLIALVVPGIFLAIKLSVAGPASVLDDKNPIEAMKASWDATTGSWWEIFAVFLVISVIVSIIGLVPYISSFFAFSGVIAMALIFGSLFGKRRKTGARRYR